MSASLSASVAAAVNVVASGATPAEFEADPLDGVRLRVVGQSVAGAPGYELVQVEATSYCAGGAPYVPGGPCP